MRITHFKLDNWRNFRSVDVPLRWRAFVIGPNASGKSNLLDGIRFLRDIAEPEGGFQRAVKIRGGVSQLRCLHARQNPNVGVEVHLELEGHEWTYRLEFAQDNQRRPFVALEQVSKDGSSLLNRPIKSDQADPSRLTQTHLEQVNANKDFREVTEFLAQLRYMHIVPQLIRDSDRMIPKAHDPFGSDFLEQVAKTPKRTLDSRLRRINKALQVAVPQLRELTIDRDDRGVPHLKGRYEHWRPKAGWQTEEHFSDGTLRLLGLLWASVDGKAPLLLEEPELSLHPAVVRHVPAMLSGVGRRSRRQIIVSTHSPDLLSDESIAPEEVLLLDPTEDGTRVHIAAEDQQIMALLQGGLTMADAAIPRSAPQATEQLAIFN
jgi:predicted ATPase